MSEGEVKAATAEEVKEVPAESAEGQQEEEAVPPITLDVLRLTRTAQNQYGLRYDNYGLYRTYCSRKVHRLRRSLKLTGSSRRYQPAAMTAEKMSTDRHLFVPLFLAERAWAHAMELKDDHAAGEMPKRVRFHIVRKFSKAVVHIRQLAELCKGKVDSKSALEIEAYLYWMEGNKLLEKEEWEAALKSFVHARKIYEEMGKIGDPEEQELCKERVADIDPSLRYCKFNLSGGSAEDISDLLASHNPALDQLNAKLEAAMEESRKQQANSMDKVTWKGRTVNLKSEKLRVAMIEAQNAAFELDRTNDDDEKLAQYSHLFAAYATVLEAVRADASAIADATKNEKTKSTKTVAEESNLAYLHKYVSYLKITKTIERNELLAATKEKSAKKTKPEDLVRIYDSLINNLVDLEQISDKEDTEYAKLLAARSLAYKAHRCFFVALSYAYQREWPEALALCDRCEVHLASATEHHRASAKATEAGAAKLQALAKRVRGEKCLIKAKAFLSSGAQEETKEEAKSGLAVSEALGQYSTNPKKLAAFPPECSPVACKPVLFDLAHMQLEFPSLEQRMPKKSMWKWW